MVSAVAFAGLPAAFELLEATVLVLEEVAGVLGVVGCTISMTSFGIFIVGILSPMYPCCLKRILNSNLLNPTLGNLLCKY